jgi:hypothetical protein
VGVAFIGDGPIGGWRGVGGSIRATLVPFSPEFLDRKFPHQRATVLGELWADEDLAELDRRRCHAVPLLLDRAELKGSDADALPAVGSLANIACEFAISAEEQK